MELLEDLRRHWHLEESALRGWACIYVQHILESNRKCAEFLESLGLDRQLLRVFGKGYSSSSLVLAKYEQCGYNVEDRQHDYRFDEPFDDSIIRNVSDGISQLAQAGCGKILIIDEGGIASRAVRTLKLNPHLQLACTELTTRGAVHYPLLSQRYPVIDVARSFVKKTIESKCIAKSMLECLDTELVRQNLPALRDVRVGIIGLGSIGGELSRQLAIREVLTLRHDLVTDRSDATDIAGVLSSSDILLSSTGGGYVSIREFERLVSDKVLVNCGSSDVEFNLWQIATSLNHSLIRFGVFSYASPPWSDTATLDLGEAEVKFLRGGFPINFDGSPDPIPENQIQLTRAALMAGALQSVRTLVPGVHALDPEIQELLLRSMRSAESLDQQNASP